MTKRIGIVGSGTAGLQLAFALKEDFEVTVICQRTADEIKNGRIMSTQVHFAAARKRENRFHMPKWEKQTSLESVHLTIGDQKLFVGELKGSALSVDQRYYFSQCMNELAKTGVPFRYERIAKESVHELVNEFDLLIDCTGKTGPLVPFPIEQELSPFQTPQRKCIVGYFVGIQPNLPLGVNVTVLPEMGEMFEIPALTEHGPVTILFITAVPHSALDAFKGIADAREFAREMKSMIQQFFPHIHQRIEPENFELCDEHGFLQIAFTPVIRKPYLMVHNKVVVGCGDSVFLNDPITGQGCNLASYCAEQLYETLLEYKNSAWDEQIGESYWNRTKQFVKEVTEWTNAMTLPLPEHIVQKLIQGAQNQAIANEIAEWFANPNEAYKEFFPEAIHQAQ